MKLIGYAYLHEHLALGVCPPKHPARVRPVTRIMTMGDEIAVPAGRAPDASLLAHLVFALKHEGIDLAILAGTLPHLPTEELQEALQNSPNGIYLRKLAYLYEAMVKRLPFDIAVSGRAVPLFDPEHYIVGPSVRDSRWRIDFNGLGTLEYCATVRRSSVITALLEEDILRQAATFMASLPTGMLDRAIQWAYLSETQSSFAIEQESPSPDKQQRFMQLLRQAHERRPLTEAYLVELQNSTISNPFDKAATFRHEQNYLHNGLPGALGVSYLPPPPALCDELMKGLMAWANLDSEKGIADGVSPLVVSAVLSFGFVFLHPFMDGNGRISRFLIHHTLCRKGGLDRDNLLPISVAMKRHEAEYLAALEAFSKPTREHWNVTWIDADQYDFHFKGLDALYRFWDATEAVAFLLKMAKAALEDELKAETHYLACFDHVYAAINEAYDIRGSDLARLVMMCLSNEGRLSNNRRKQFRYQVADEVLDAIETEARKVLEAHQNEQAPPD
ncbi:Fic family protein [Vreelandella indica]|uniref:Fic family protein n=1 Tax=Vreelandella indica TaxID=3126500 RepID=UPI00300DCD22|tara:strand:+ start:511 stop:2019 length:1509 start_codon:yes stop_codon:yes gene_type:complete